jgi:glutamyl-tRNA reductase
MIGILGLNHKTAPVHIRECLAFTEDEIAAICGEYRAVEADGEVVVLSTCNRSEVYFSISRSCEQKDFRTIEGILEDFRKIDSDALTESLYRYSDREAVDHLLRVTSGLDSMVLGENQVLGQVKEAYRISSSRKLTSTIFNRLYHMALETGKRVRSETRINEGASSISYAAVELASKIFSHLPNHPVLLVGAGETGQLVLQSLKERGCEHLHVANRTSDRAEKIAAEYGAETADFENLAEALIHSDIVLTSTGSPEPIITGDLLGPIMKKRRSRPLFCIDLSVPRNIEESVKNIDAVFLYDIDDLNAVVQHNYERRRGEIVKAEQIILEKGNEFFTWVASLGLSPTIKKLKNHLGKITGEELNKLSNRLPENEYSRVAEYASFIEGKYLGLIVKRLKDLSKNGQQLEYLDMVNKLFELERTEEHA